MTGIKQFTTHAGIDVPVIKGAGGGKGGGKIVPNSLFSTDILYLTTALGEGPVYRISPNGPQDIQIQDSAIDDLLRLDTDGSIDTSKFLVSSVTGTVTQNYLPKFGNETVTPQGFSSPVGLKFGNINGIPSSKVTEQETSANNWDTLRFVFLVNELYKSDDKGNVNGYSTKILIEIYDKLLTPIITKRITITGKTDTAFKQAVSVDIPADVVALPSSLNGYKFTITKISKDSDDVHIKEDVRLIGWDEIKHTPQAYPRTAVIGYGIKATDEHTGGVPNFTTMLKGLLVKVPSNYNQPILSTGEIDWRQLEVQPFGTTNINNKIVAAGYTQQGYRLQKSGTSSLLKEANPQLYVGTWDGTFVYSWTQNPVWIIYDILTNNTYGLGIPEENIDKYKFYQVAMYCDACDAKTGRFVGVDGLADGSYRNKPNNLYTAVRQNQMGLPVSTPIKERRFILDVSLTEQEKAMDALNKIAASFRCIITYAGGKISLASDMPEEYPVMLFNEATIKAGSFQISGNKESDVYTGVDVNYIEPTNHFKRETVRIDTADANDGTDTSDAENIASIDLTGVTRRSQATRTAQYHLAASRYQRRNISFTTGTDAIHLAPGDVISISSQGSGVAYGYGGKVIANRNLLTFTAELDNAAWIKNNATVTANATTAPDGSNTADFLVATTTAAQHLIQSSVVSVVAGRTYYTSVYLKAGAQTSAYLSFAGLFSQFALINLITGAITNGPPGSYTQALPNGWWRCIFPSVPTTTTTGARLAIWPKDLASIAGDGVSGIYVWGAQVELDMLTAYQAISTTIPVTLEHFTVPSITDEVFTQNTYPIALRIIKQNSDKLDMYLVSNTDYELSSYGKASSGYDTAVVRVLSRFDPITKTITALSTGFSANIAPAAGDLWSLGEMSNPSNFYSSKAGKLFKVTNLKRESSEEIVVNAVEYISNVYVDSDTFINYEPTAYTDISSPFSVPPTPIFTLAAVARSKTDGSVAVDGILKNRTELKGYGQKFETEYFIARPEYTTLVANVTASNPLTLKLDSSEGLANGIYSTRLSGKTGFTTPIGEIKLLCNSIAQVAPDKIELTIEGLSSCIDQNFNKHVLLVNDGSIPQLNGIDLIQIPVAEKISGSAALNFVGYESAITELTQPIVSYNLTTNKITLKDELAGVSTLYSVLPTEPFYVKISQVLATNYYANNSFYVQGTSFTHTQSGLVNQSLNTNTYELAVKPRTASAVRLYIDGKLTNPEVVNLNKTNALKANVQYTRSPSATHYRTEVDYYTVPTLEVGDSVEISHGNTFTIANTSFDPTSAGYSAALTSNNIYRVQLSGAPAFDASGFSITNNSLNPVGVTANVSGNICTLDYDVDNYPGMFKLANNSIYRLELGSVFEKLFLTEDLVIPDLPIGLSTVRARNRNTLGRLSPFVEKSVEVVALPIQKVENIEITESLYREQTGGVSVRVTCTFSHILNQEVTDYEISYRVDNATAIGVEDNISGVSSYNTVKVSSAGVDEQGKIRFTINNINRGDQAGIVSISFKITPLNGSLRGITAYVDKSIVGKTTAPANIYNFTGGQQNEIITLLWQYERTPYGDLVDLDLKEVEIRRIQGSPNVSTISNRLQAYAAASPLVEVSAGSARKSVPIDIYGEYTYLARTRDTSGNYSNDVAYFVISTTRPQRSTLISAYSEDNPSAIFASGVINKNSAENFFPSFSSTVRGGLVYPDSTAADKANGSSSGWSAIGGSPTDLLANSTAVYTTQIRDFGQEVVGSVSLDLAYTQQLQSSYNDQQIAYTSLISEVNATANVLRDTGIGTILGFGNPGLAGRYDANNKTWMTGSVNGNVWGIWNQGRYVGDTANLNSYALIAGIINANAIALGASFYANGKPTGGNSLANVTTIAAPFTLVNFNQYNDVGTTTYVGDLGAVTTQTFIRLATSNVYYANGNVNSLAFIGGAVNEGFIPYEAGSKLFRYFQIKFIVNNSRPDEFDFTLDKFRYTIDKEQTVYSNTVVYNASPTTVNFASAKFINRPVVSYTLLDKLSAEANPAIVITTALSNTDVSFKLFASNGTGAYPANSTANVMVTVIGV